jgi:proteic killer suppression protein
MEILFTSTKMQKLCSSEKVMLKTLGQVQAKKLQQRLAELKAAETLADIPKGPPPRCHELSGDRQGQLSVDLVHPQRLMFRPEQPVPLKDDGGLDWSRVTKIEILEITDPH